MSHKLTVMPNKITIWISIHLQNRKLHTKETIGITKYDVLNQTCYEQKILTVHHIKES